MLRNRFIFVSLVSLALLGCYDPEVDYQKGKNYYSGENGLKNPKKAIEHLLLAAEDGHPGAQPHICISWRYTHVIEP